MFAIIKTGIKPNQSEIRFILTVTTLMYVAHDAIINKTNEFEPIGRPKITSVIIPDKNINPYPKICGRFNTQ